MINKVHRNIDPVSDSSENGTGMKEFLNRLKKPLKNTLRIASDEEFMMNELWQRGKISKKVKDPNDILYGGADKQEKAIALSVIITLAGMDESRKKNLMEYKSILLEDLSDKELGEFVAFLKSYNYGKNGKDEYDKWEGYMLLRKNTAKETLGLFNKFSEDLDGIAERKSTLSAMNEMCSRGQSEEKISYIGQVLDRVLEESEKVDAEIIKETIERANNQSGKYGATALLGVIDNREWLDFLPDDYFQEYKDAAFFGKLANMLFQDKADKETGHNGKKGVAGLDFQKT